MAKFPVTRNTFALLSIDDDSSDDDVKGGSVKEKSNPQAGDSKSTKSKNKKKSKGKGKEAGKQAAELRSMFMGSATAQQRTALNRARGGDLSVLSNGASFQHPPIRTDEDIGEIDIEEQRKLLLEFEEVKKHKRAKDITTDLPFEDFQESRGGSGTLGLSCRDRLHSPPTAAGDASAVPVGVGGSMSRKGEKIYIKRPPVSPDELSVSAPHSAADFLPDPHKHGRGDTAKGSSRRRSEPSVQPSNGGDDGGESDHQGSINLEEEVSRLKGELEETETKLSKARRRNRLMVDLLRDTDQKELVEVREELFRLRQEKENLAGLNEELTTQLSEISAENEQLKSENHELKKELWKSTNQGEGGGTTPLQHTSGHHHGTGGGGGRKPRLNSVCSNDGAEGGKG